MNELSIFFFFASHIENPIKIHDYNDGKRRIELRKSKRWQIRNLLTLSASQPAIQPASQHDEVYHR